jgi:hypothetical protein
VRLSGNEVTEAAMLAALVTAAVAIPVWLAFSTSGQNAARVALCDERGGFMTMGGAGQQACLIGGVVLRFDGLEMKR